MQKGHFKALPKGLVDDPIAKMKEEEAEILLKIEKHNDVIYCYRKDNNEFVGQGKSLEEVAEQFKKKYPSNDARILKEDADGLMP